MNNRECICSWEKCATNSSNFALTRFYATVLLVFCHGCGYVSSGEWTDDKNNWTRAFGEPVPAGVTVVSSWYMRTPHFTAEYAWYFKLKLDSQTRQRVETDPDCQKLESTNAILAIEQTYSDRPSWFPMDNLDRYDVYQSKSQPNFLMLVEQDGDVSYWTSYQL